MNPPPPSPGIAAGATSPDVGAGVALPSMPPVTPLSSALSLSQSSPESPGSAALQVSSALQVSPPLVRRLAAEVFGSFCLVFAGTGAIVINDLTGGGVGHLGVAATFGLIVMAMIYAVGDVSGAHLNPAVTLGFVVAGRLRRRDVVPYIVAQCCGALLASLGLLMLFGDRASLGATLPSGSAGQSFGLEVILTAMLMFVVLHVSTGPREVGVMAGIAVGGVVALEAAFAGPISGASMNPARSLAPALVSGNTAHLWVYLTAPAIGAMLAVPCWALTRPTGSPLLTRSTT